MHQSRGFDPVTGVARASGGRTLDGGVRRGARPASASSATTSSRSPPRCASRPGWASSAGASRERVFDVGIAEQHAVTSAAGLASGGLHPVVAIYATFLNRAFDQVLMDVALHRLPVTFVLDRAGITGEDGPSHNGMWDLAHARRRARHPHRRAARRADAARASCTRRSAISDGPTRRALPEDPARRAICPRCAASAGWTCWPSPRRRRRSTCCVVVDRRDGRRRAGRRRGGRGRPATRCGSSTRAG